MVLSSSIEMFAAAGDAHIIIHDATSTGQSILGQFDSISRDLHSIHFGPFGILNSFSIGHDQYITDEFFVSTNTGLVYYPLKESKEVLPTVSVTLGFKKLLPADYKSDYFITRLGLEFIKRKEGIYSQDIWEDLWNDYYILPVVSFSYLIN